MQWRYFISIVLIGVDALVFVSRSVAESARAYLNVDEPFDKVVKKFDIFGGKKWIKKNWVQNLQSLTITEYVGGDPVQPKLWRDVQILKFQMSKLV